jgi:serine/threonine protein kinase
LDKLLFDSNVKLSEEYKIRLIREIAAGMLHLHKYNIVHRDLAARNILLTESGQPKISVLFLFFESLSFFSIKVSFVRCLIVSMNFNEMLNIFCNRFVDLNLIEKIDIEMMCRILECHEFFKKKKKEKYEYFNSFVLCVVVVHYLYFIKQTIQNFEIDIQQYWTYSLDGS